MFSHQFRVCENPGFFFLVVFTPILISSILFCSRFQGFQILATIRSCSLQEFQSFEGYHKKRISCNLAPLPIESNDDQFRCRPKMPRGIRRFGALRQGRFTNPARLRCNENSQQLRASYRPILDQYFRKISSIN